MFDTSGVLIISVLIALFSFLTARAWKLKTAILKWGGGIIAGLISRSSTLCDPCYKFLCSNWNTSLMSAIL